jgi:hypothetical protein
MRSFCFFGGTPSEHWMVYFMENPIHFAELLGVPPVRKPPNNMETTSRHDAAQELIRYQVYHWNNPPMNL